MAWFDEFFDEHALVVIELENLEYAVAGGKLDTAKWTPFLEAKRLVQLAGLGTAIWAIFIRHGFAQRLVWRSPP